MRLVAAEGQPAMALDHIGGPPTGVEPIPHGSKLRLEEYRKLAPRRDLSMLAEVDRLLLVHPAVGAYRRKHAKGLEDDSKSRRIAFDGSELERLLGHLCCPIGLLAQIHEKVRQGVCSGQLPSQQQGDDCVQDLFHREGFAALRHFRQVREDVAFVQDGPLEQLCHNPLELPACGQGAAEGREVPEIHRRSNDAGDDCVHEVLDARLEVLAQACRDLQCGHLGRQVRPRCVKARETVPGAFLGKFIEHLADLETHLRQNLQARLRRQAVKELGPKALVMLVTLSTR
mmetsp:Transcript_109977/g.354689  ORF Transcript_109977/g.354689 Transcript_109977/m.354689 type:complete len:286 (-) Transcript_109977:684-1541(-)